MATAKPTTREYTHIELNVEVQSIGGHYILDKEVRMPYRGEEVLYVVGTGVVDTSCCGMGEHDSTGGGCSE